MRCLRTKAKLESPEWNRQPACSCPNCSKYFELQVKTGSLQSKEVREFVNKEE